MAFRAPPQEFILAPLAAASTTEQLAVTQETTPPSGSALDDSRDIPISMAGDAPLRIEGTGTATSSHNNSQGNSSGAGDRLPLPPAQSQLHLVGFDIEWRLHRSFALSLPGINFAQAIPARCPNLDFGPASNLSLLSLEQGWEPHRELLPPSLRKARSSMKGIK
jgi:hypothetical protein